jgi:ferrous iron transport protein B
VSAVEQRARTVAMVGNPNVGKSTLFNALSGSEQRIANYPGVTVDPHMVEITDGDVPLTLIDLPGTYGLRPSALDDAVVANVLRERTPDVVLVVLDASNLRRNLYLLSEVMDLERPVVVALNMVDEARRGGCEVPTDAIRKATGLQVVETVGTTGQGVDALRKALEQASAPSARVWAFADAAQEQRLAEAAGDQAWDRLQTLLKEESNLRTGEVAGRYAWVNEVLVGYDAAAARARSERLDRVFLHKAFGPLIFLSIMATIFQAIFTWAGPLMDGIDWLFGQLGEWAAATLPGVFGELLTSLAVDGIIAGVGSVVIFLPQIVILFLVLGLLEDSGYMARAAFLVDRPLRLVGLSGRSFIPMLSSFACAVPGVMATRTIPGRAERLLAVFLAPLMTCSARLPVYTLLIAAFVPAVSVAGPIGLQGLVLFGLYLGGMLSAAVLGLVVTRLQRGRRRGRELPMVVELPPYRWPTAWGVLLKLKVRVGDFLKRAGTVIFAVSVVLWVLMTFPRVEQTPGMSDAEHAAVSLDQSVAGRFGHLIEPAIEPLGYDWKIGVGLFASFAAREVFVGTMGIIYSVGEDADEESEDLRAQLVAARRPDGSKVFSLATVFSLLVFYIFALQCGATVAVVKRESGTWGFAIGQLVAFLALAWLGAFVTYRVMAALGYA